MPDGTSAPESPSIEVLSAAVAHAYDAVMITDAVLDFPGPHILYVNSAFERMSGWSAAELATRTPRVMQGPDTDPATLQRLREALDSGSPFQGSAVNYRRDGSPFIMEWSISPVVGGDGRPQYFVAVQRDVTAFRRRLADAEHGAATDGLTGLPNRRAYDARLASMLAEPGKTVGLLAIDIDRFKSVNDSHGHGAGDSVLVEVARRMSDIARATPNALLARTGGEEFSMLVQGVGTEHEMEALGESMRVAIAADPISTAAITLDVTISVGAVMARPPDIKSDRLAIVADRALYRAKETGRNRVVLASFSPS
ncbi:MAG: diguanylate cyclase [Gemmatimonadaceae bacterium]|nr:diguanylate cyclase [Gemmatimonadaceae bacterium]